MLITHSRQVQKERGFSCSANPKKKKQSNLNFAAAPCHLSPVINSAFVVRK
jgi:hypothetical protein